MRRAEGDLDLLGAPLPDEEPVVLSDVLDDRLVHLVAGDPDRVAVDGARHGDDGHLGRPAADVDDQVTARLVDRQARADRGCRRLLDQVHLARVGLERRVAHGSLLDLGDPRGDADHDARPLQTGAQPATRGDLPRCRNEVPQHLLCDVEVGDHAVLQGPDRQDVVGRAAEHRLGFAPHPDHRTVRPTHGDDRGLVQDDAFVPNEHQRIGGPQVDREVRRKESEQLVGQHPRVALARPAPHDGADRSLRFERRPDFEADARVIER